MYQNLDKNSIFDTQIDTNKIYVSMKTKFIPRVYSNDHATVYLHITGQGIRKRFNLDIQIYKKFWSQKNQRLIVSNAITNIIKTTIKKMLISS